MINENLKKYIEEKIFPLYSKNDKGHGIDHIMYVINRSLKFAATVADINLDMVYTIAAYHDVGHSIDADNHEVVSAQMLMQDEGLRQFFMEKDIVTMSEAVEDHRASLEYEPRSIYGKIVSSADRNTEIEKPFRRTYEYRIIHMPDSTLRQIMDESYEHLVKKFGHKGYANEKMYFEDEEYKSFLEEMGRLLDDRAAFDQRYIEINNLGKQLIKQK